MADQVNINKLENRVAEVAATTRRMEQELQKNTQQLDQVTNTLGAVSQELQQLQQDFVRYMEENKRATILQKAATELVRVRQELEQNFGNYKIVRETMLGVLQATDLALVKKTTISQVTEELMLSTPDYWLAPCLVAISAWIGNDRDLSDRAIAEAVRRDEEKTALTMALICRRNNRTVTCYEWLSIYFANQSATHFTESNFTYLNAYLNGVFGPDEKHMCDDYVANWMHEVQNERQDLAISQTQWWNDYCQHFTVDLDKQFPQLNSCVREYSQINDYVSRINSVDRITHNFSSMQNAQVDQQSLKKDIDKTLITLISRYDTCEEPLRKEEKYLQALRYFDGDADAAKRSILEANARRKEDTIDLISQMSNVIVDESHSRLSERKTAVNFLSGHIKNGFDAFITEKKDYFPKQITMEIGTWTGITSDGSNGQSLEADFIKHTEQERQVALDAIPKNKAEHMKIAAIVLGVLGVILAIVALPIGLLSLVGAFCCFRNSNKEKKVLAETIETTNANFDTQIATGKAQISTAITEWREARSLVMQFEAEGQHAVVA